jgi:hypothetical protein
MALDDKKEQLSSSRVPESPKEKAPVQEPKKEIDTSVWGGSQYLKGEKLRNWARSDEAWKKTNLSESERIKISSDLFGKSGDYLDKNKAGKTLSGLEKEMSYAKTDADKERIKKEIRVAKSILGK